MHCPVGEVAVVVRVLIVDDSAVVRQALQTYLSRDPEIQVVGAAPNPFVARDMIVELKPDVLTLDVEMPRMDGISFLRALMKYHPLPVVVISSLTPAGGEMAMTALAAGAVEVLTKAGNSYQLGDWITELCGKVKAAAAVNMARKVQSLSAAPVATSPVRALARTTHQVIALGASTGGPTALETVLRGMPANAPGTVIVVHMPPQFTKSFAERLNRASAMEVREAQEGDSVIPGVALVAPGSRHMILRRSGARYYVSLLDTERVNYHRPSVDVLFNSVAQEAGSNVVAALMTGMGDDGARGLLALRKAGASTIAEAEESCIVYGMPRAAAEMGAADEVVPLPKIADRVLFYVQKHDQRVTSAA